MAADARLPEQHPVLHHIARFVLRPLFRLYFRIRGEGLTNLPPGGPYLLAPNHVSMLDWAFISYFLPYLVRFMVDRSFYETPVLGFGLRVNGAIPIRAGRPARAQPGIISLAAATGTPILPVAVRGAYEAFPRWRRLPRPRTVTVVFGRPLPPPPSTGDRTARQAQADGLMTHIAAMLDGREPETAPW